MEIFAWLNFSFIENEITACSLQIVYLEHPFYERNRQLRSSKDGNSILVKLAIFCLVTPQYSFYIAFKHHRGNIYCLLSQQFKII